MKLLRNDFKRNAIIDSRVDRGKPDLRGRKKKQTILNIPEKDSTSDYYRFLGFMERTVLKKYKTYYDHEIQAKLESIKK